MKRKRSLWLLLCVPTLLLGAAWVCKKSLDLSGVTTTAIRNSKGQPAEVWWWRPPDTGSIAIFNNQENKGFDSYSIWNSVWMENRWFKVALIGPPQNPKTAPIKNGVKVYVLGDYKESRDRLFLTQREDLTRTR